jgi:hypothetical protein
MKRGDCYQAAATFMLYRGTLTDIRLCHGKVTGRNEVAGIRFGHAWIEIDWIGPGMCLEVANGQKITMPKAKYYEWGQILPEEVTRYTQHETRLMLLKHKHWGPWN